MAEVPTQITVRVIARDGKFLGDDIGGALVTIRDVDTGQLLAHGRTRGGSGPESIMTAALTRNQPIPTEDSDNSACRYDVVLDLEGPRHLEISAYGPLAAPQAANRVTETMWVYPGHNLSPDGTLREDGFLIEIPGLVVQVIEPPQHFLPYEPNPSQPIPIRANVTMMCGCPIAPNPFHDKPSYWPDCDFRVVATVLHNGATTEFPMKFNSSAPGGAPSQFFTNDWTPGDLGVFEITIFAYQYSTGNTGLDRTTVNLQS
jgi:hypothetical protein